MIFTGWSSKLTFGDDTMDLTLYDTIGTDEYDVLRHLVYKIADIFILCFSIDSIESFQSCQNRFYIELLKHRPNVPIILLGTKSDLIQSGEFSEKLHSIGHEFVQRDDAERFADSINAVYMECSALTMEGIDQIFVQVYKLISATTPPKKNCSVM
jgi:small GTP-binding protein